MSMTQCVFCGDPLNADAAGVYQRVSGWERRRAQGGTNALRLPEREHKWACHSCIEERVRGHERQPELF